jgi:hypothetical protein
MAKQFAPLDKRQDNQDGAHPDKRDDFGPANPDKRDDYLESERQAARGIQRNEAVTRHQTP